MTKFTKLFSLIIVVALIIRIFPAGMANAAEKKYKLSLTGESDLGNADKIIYNYNKMSIMVKYFVQLTGGF